MYETIPGQEASASPSTPQRHVEQLQFPEHQVHFAPISNLMSFQISEGCDRTVSAILHLTGQRVACLMKISVSLLSATRFSRLKILIELNIYTHDQSSNTSVNEWTLSQRAKAGLPAWMI